MIAEKAEHLTLACISSASEMARDLESTRDQLAAALAAYGRMLNSRQAIKGAAGVLIGLVREGATPDPAVLDELEALVALPNAAAGTPWDERR